MSLESLVVIGLLEVRILKTTHNTTSYSNPEGPPAITSDSLALSSLFLQVQFVVLRP